MNEYDAYGGWLKVKGKKTGFFHVEQIQGRWWLVTPEGNAFFSKGICNVSYSPEADSSPAPPADTVAWAKTVSRQLRDWNFNTVGAWSARELVHHGDCLRPGHQHGGFRAEGPLAQRGRGRFLQSRVP